MSRRIAILCLVLASSFTVGESTSARKLTVEEGRALVLAAIDPRTTKLPHFGIDQSHDKYSPEFYHFDVTAETGGSPVIGFYAVDPITADIWNGVLCERISSSRIHKVQTALRAKIGLSSAEYKEKRRPGPMCSKYPPRPNVITD